MPSTMLALQGTFDAGDRLNGWKDIAAYIGKSVSAVQRWERNLGLPVRRIKTNDGQIVSASRREIDEWRVRLEGQAADSSVALALIHLWLAAGLVRRIGSEVGDAE